MLHSSNGINALRIQFIACLISPFIFIGVAILLINYYHLGPYSLFIASIACNFNGLILAPIQYHMIVNKQKKGIWIKVIRMKILYDHQMFLKQKYGGITKYFCELMKNLPKEIHMICRFYLQTIST